MLLIIVILTFCLMQWLPGDPFAGPKAVKQEVLDVLHAKYGLDKPVYQQLFIYIGKVFTLDFGVSLKTQRPILDTLKEVIPNSAAIGIRAFLFSLLIGIGMGIVSAIKHDKIVDRVTSAVSVIGTVIPGFVIAAVFNYVFGVKFKQWFGWGFPIFGLKTELHMVLPSLALAIGSIPFYARMMRSSMLDILSQDYVKTAKAKGLNAWQVMKKHVLRNSLIPIVTVAPPALLGIFTGTLTIERIFGIAGMGDKMATAINELDYFMIMAVAILSSALMLISYLIVDILYVVVDPRIKLAKKRGA
jgi:oligopeptide transport system permease protein